MVVNCNGLGNAKKSSFHAAIAHHTPDFVFGCESKLDDSFSSYSIFPSNYSIYRKDRNAGDFRHPDINWDDQSTTNPATSTCHQKLLDILLHNSLSQTVREVTRPSSNNILDLVVKSNPALVENVCVQSGISDHNIVTFTLAANPKISVKPLRKIYQFHKADEQQLRDAAAEFATEFL